MRKITSFVILALTVAFVAGFLLSTTGAVAAPVQRTRTFSLSIEAFLDTAGYHSYTDYACAGCNGYWDNADWCGEFLTPLPPVSFVIRNAETDEEITHFATDKYPDRGRSYAYVNLPADQSYILEVEAVPEGFEACPTASLSRLITPAAYPFGYARESFYFWWGCPPTPPGVEPPPPGSGGGYYYGCGVYPIIGEVPAH